jgi:hypothetical protein
MTGPRIRAIEVLGLACKSHFEPNAILAAVCRTEACKKTPCSK